jgi:hypothetical protein
MINNIKILMTTYFLKYQAQMSGSQSKQLLVHCSSTIHTKDITKRKQSLRMYFSCNQLTAMSIFGSKLFFLFSSSSFSFWIDLKQFQGSYISESAAKKTSAKVTQNCSKSVPSLTI